jgi:hypothetical protein
MPEDYVDLDAAAAAAKELFSIGEAPDEEPGTEVEEQSDEVVEEAPAADDETTESPAEPEAEEEDFIPRADLESLLEGLEGEAREAVVTAYKSFQRLSTKQSQANAELRRAFEGVDPTEARQAYDFVQKLGSDPEYALSVHQELTAALEQAGMSPAAASREASRQIEETTSEGERYDLSEYADNPFVQELNELKQWRAAQEAEAQERMRNEAMERQIREIESDVAELRRKNPKLEDEDMDVIYKIAASTGGDVFAAKEYFDGVRDRLVTDYVATKKAVPKSSGGGGGAPHSEEPIIITNTDMAHALAVERAKHLMEGGN